MPPFDAQTLERAVQDALATQIDIPAGHTGACLTVANPHGVTAVIATKIGPHWTVAAQATHPWQGKTTDYGVTLRGSW